jgi:CRISPR-associated protein Csm2
MDYTRNRYGQKSTDSTFDRYGKKGGKQGSDRHQNNSYKGLPGGYLDKGYFDEKGNLHEELILAHAEEIALKFGNSPNRNENLTFAQLRRYYSHAVNAGLAYKSHRNQGLCLNSIKQLDPFVAEAQGKGKVPKIFRDFIKRNIEEIKTIKDITEGFIPHFQAIVAYFSGFYKS